MDALPSPVKAHLLRSALSSRAIGSLLGSALGDTIGLYTEFLSASASQAAYPSRRFTLLPTPTPFHFDLHRGAKPPAHWTDDTDHALLLILAFLHTASTDSPHPAPLPTQRDLAARLRIWVQQGLRPLETMPLGLGRLVGSVVATKGFEERPEEVARECWDRTGKKAAPNGSLMRTHPLGVMCVWRGEEETFRVAAELSRVTHVDARCVVACVIGTGLVRALVRGEVLDERGVSESVKRGKDWVAGKGEAVDEEELKKYVECGNLEELQLDESTSIGYVYKALGAGVLLLRLAMRKMAESGGSLLVRSKLFEELITNLVMCGGDADTNACFAGALLGAFLGYGALPDHWNHGLKHEEWFMGKAEAVCRVLGMVDGRYVGEEDKDTLPDGGKPHISHDEMEGRWMVLQADVAKKMEEQAKANATKIKTKSGWAASLPWGDKTKR